MKKMIRIGALSLALIASLLLLTTDKTNAIGGDVSLKILTGTSSCTYGTSLNLGTHVADFNAFSLTGVFTTPATFSCTDYDGLATWSMTLAASTDLTNGSQTITKNNLFLKVFPNTVVSGACTAGTNTTTVTSIGSSAGVIVAKTSAAGQICTINATGIQLSINVPAGQAVGTYTGTLTLTTPW